MRYTCMAFGWYQELLREARVDDFTAAEAKLLEMLENGAMIVHCYRETDSDDPELVGRHRRLRSFVAAVGRENFAPPDPPHQVERFLLDACCVEAWRHAIDTGALLDGRWSVVQLCSLSELPQTGAQPSSSLYGQATLVSSLAECGSPAASPPDRVRLYNE